MRQVGARRDDPHALGLVKVVQAVLLLNFLLGTGDHAVGRAQGGFFGLDTARDAVGGFDLAALDATGQQLLAFVAPQRMPGMHQRNTQLVRQARTHITGVGVMAVQHVRHAGLALEVGQHVVGEVFQRVPQHFLAQVFVFATGDAHDAGFVGQRLTHFGIVGADLAVDHAPRQQHHPLNVGTLAQGTRQLHHVFGLAAGVGIPPELQVMPTDQAMHTDQHDVQRLLSRQVLLFHSPTPARCAGHHEVTRQGIQKIRF